MVTNTSAEANVVLPDIIQQNIQMPVAIRNRQTIVWRVPGLGRVEMYINPQKISIYEKKLITPQRTKGGYVVQYWGSELTTINISGNTGSSSIEGINILRDLYLAEQKAFNQVASTLADRLQEYSSAVSLSGIVNTATRGAYGGVTGTLINSLIGGTANPPLLPTLGSLAVAPEMYYGGIVYKGFFTAFDVDERADATGFFDYTLNFTVIDQRGIRKNFTSWSRSPVGVDPNTGLPMGKYNVADSNSVPLSFSGESMGISNSSLGVR